MFQAVIRSWIWFENLLSITAWENLEMEVASGSPNKTSEVYQWAAGNIESETQQAIAK